MVIKVRTNNGFKEDAYGFYSEPEARGVTDLPRLIIGMPGALRSEFDKHSERFGKIEESVQVPITYIQRQNILALARDWDNHKYQLTEDNCISFVENVAQKADIPLPARTGEMSANQFIAALRVNYAAKQARLAEELKQKQLQAQRDAEIARQKAEQAKMAADAERARQAQIEADRIPPGWVACTCPQEHARFGKFVRGTLYHPDNLRCSK